jgi:hypothetical protein
MKPHVAYIFLQLFERIQMALLLVHERPHFIELTFLQMKMMHEHRLYKLTLMASLSRTALHSVLVDIKNTAGRPNAASLGQ